MPSPIPSRRSWRSCSPTTRRPRSNAASRRSRRRPRHRRRSWSWTTPAPRRSTRRSSRRGAPRSPWCAPTTTAARPGATPSHSSTSWRRPYRHAWVIDDDMRPDPECLERLWVVAAKDPARAFVFPVSFQLDGTFGAWPSWCGFLVAREIVEEVGVPMAELFWWAEDTEYLQWRIPQAGYPMRVVGDAYVRHDAIRQGDVRPGVEVLLRGPQHALRPPAREEADRLLPPQRHQAVRAGHPARARGPAGAAAGDGPRPLRRGTRPPRHPVPHRVRCRSARPDGAAPDGSPSGPARPRTIPTTRSWSSSDSADPVGRHRPWSKIPAHTDPPTTWFPANTGWRWSGFQVGRDSMSSASRARRTASRSAPNRSGSTVTHVSQWLGSP